MIVANRTLFLAAAALCAAGLPAAAPAQVQPEIPSTYCSLFLGDLGTSPADYILFRSFLQGYLAGRPGSDTIAKDPDRVAALMSSLTDYCRGHADEDFSSAIAAVLKK